MAEEVGKVLPSIELGPVDTATVLATFDGANCDVPIMRGKHISYHQVHEIRVARTQTDALSKFPPSAFAWAISFCKRASAFLGTMDMNPIRGGSTDGCVKLP